MQMDWMKNVKISMQKNNLRKKFARYGLLKKLTPKCKRVTFYSTD